MPSLIKTALILSVALSPTALEAAKRVEPPAPKAEKVAPEGSLHGGFGPMALGLGAAVLLLSLAKGGDKAEAAPSTQAKLPENAYTLGDLNNILVRAHRDIDLQKLRNAILNAKIATPDQIAAYNARSDVAGNFPIINHGISGRLALGLTGKGVSLGVMDDGIDLTSPNLRNLNLVETFDPFGFGAFSTPSSELARHATIMAQIIAGDADDGNRSRGIATGVDLYNIHAIGTPQENYRVASLFGDETSVFAYVADHKIDIASGSLTLAHSLAPEVLLDIFYEEGGLKRAVENGTIFVFATGNDGAASPTSVTALMGADPRLNNQLITVTAIDPGKDQSSSYATKCGVTKDFCLSAVGQSIALDKDGNSISVGGTSVSTAVVSASLALLKEQFPELSSPELVELILATADDIGAPGVDEIYGRGKMNLSRAFTPQGELQLMTSTSKDQSVKASDHIIRAESVLAHSLAQSLAPKELALKDDFGRAFTTSYANFINEDKEGASPLPANSLSLDFGEIAVTADEEGDYLIDFKDHAKISYGNAEKLSGTDKGALVAGYSPLGWLEENYNFSLYGLGGLALNGSTSVQGEKAKALWLSLQHSFGGVDLSLSGGHMVQNKALAGASVADGRNKTDFVTLALQHHFTQSSEIGLEASLAKSRYAGGTLIDQADITLASARAYYAFASGAHSQTTLSVGLPLSVQNGSMALDSAVSLAPFEENPGAVNRLTQNLTLSSVTPIDIGVKHSVQITPASKIDFHAALRHYEGEQDGWLSVRFEHRL